jgi:RNA polymerase sigma factor FliA
LPVREKQPKKKFDAKKHRLFGKTRIDDPDLEAVWLEYKEVGGQDLRNRLVEQYLALVRYIAERILVKLPQNVEVEDLYSAGIFGLMDAIDGYDLERGVKFETYCTTRIRGAILDSLRALDWVPRIVRNKAHRIDATWRELEVEFGRTPTDLEMAEKLELSLDQYEEMLREASAVTMVSLTEQSSDDGDSKSLRKIDILEDKRGVLPEDEVLKKEITEFITKYLSRKERLIVVLYYFEDMTMREIGASLDLSESRVCQLHSRIVARLRNQLSKYQRDLVRE